MHTVVCPIGGGDSSGDTLQCAWSNCPPPLHPGKTGYKRMLALWGFPIWVEEGLAIGGRGVSWEHSTVCMVYPPIQGRMDTSSRLHFGDIPVWVEEGLGIGGGDSSGDTLDTLQCAWSNPPIQGRLDTSSCLHFEDIPIWVEEGLGIGGGDSSGDTLDTLQCAWSNPPPPSKEDWTQAVACTLRIFPFGWRRG